MPSVAEYFATLSLSSDKASFAAGDRLLNGLVAGVAKLSGFVAGAFAIESLLSFTRSTIATLPAINDLANQTGFTAEEIQRLGFAASQTGVDQDTFNASLLKLTKNIGEAAKGGKQAVEAFTALGVSTEGIGKKDPRQIFGQLVDGLKNVKGVAERAEIAQTLFGLSGVKLAPFLAKGEEAIAAMGDEAQNLGLVIDGVTIARVDDLDDRLNVIKATFVGTGKRIVVDMLPALEKMADFLLDVVKQLTKIPKLMRTFSGELKALAFVVGSILVGAALQYAGSLVAVVAAQVGAAFTGGILGGTVGGLVTLFDLATAATTRFFARLAAAALPALALGAAILVAYLAFDDLITGLRGGESFFGTFAGHFDDLGKSLASLAFNVEGHPLLKFVAALGAAFAFHFHIIDTMIDQFFKSMTLVETLGQNIISVFQRAANAAASVVRAAAAADPGFFKPGFLNSVAGGLSAIGTAGDGAAPAPVVRDDAGRVVNGSSSSVNVGAPTFNVTVNGATDPTATGAAVGASLDSSWSQIIRSAGVDNLPNKG